jgi:hypothetical protein
VAIDQTPSESATESKPIAAIENEFPTYRAISSLAIWSMVLGLASVFCFADLRFLLVVAGSVVTGWLAIRRIRKLPDVLTGIGYASVGIGLGVLFAATSVTQILVEDFMISRDASQFADHYVEIVKDKNQSMSMPVWYTQNTAYRKTKSPDEVVAELKKSKTPAAPDPYSEKTIALQQIKDRLKGEGETIRFSKIETKAVDGLSVYANVLLELDGPGSKEFPEKEQFALLQLFKAPDGGPDDWVVQDLKFPYTPASVLARIEKKTDDGHGHSH